MKNTTQLIRTIIETEEKNYDFNDYLFNYLNIDDLETVETVEELMELLEKINEDEDITRAEIIYYSNAIKYLEENDHSLTESLEIADEMGYTPKQLNSELLASLLKSRNNQDDYKLFIDNVCSEVEKQNILK